MILATWVVIHCITAEDLIRERAKVDWTNCHLYSEEAHYRPWHPEYDLVSWDIVYWIEDGNGNVHFDPRREILEPNKD